MERNTTKHLPRLQQDLYVEDICMQPTRLERNQTARTTAFNLLKKIRVEVSVRWHSSAHSKVVCILATTNNLREDNAKHHSICSQDKRSAWLAFGLSCCPTKAND